MEKLSDDVLQAVLDAHKIFVSIDINTSKVDKYTVSLLEELKMYRGIGAVKECREAVEKQKPKNKEDIAHFQKLLALSRKVGFNERNTRHILKRLWHYSGNE